MPTKQASNVDAWLEREAGHFQLSPDTARRYNLTVAKSNDQRFDIDYASSASARYLKDLHNFFSKDTTLIGTTKTIGVKDPSERKNLSWELSMPMKEASPRPNAWLKTRAKILRFGLM